MRHYRLAAALLAPLLVVQGLHARRVTPRLPEPPGDRSGRFGSGPALRLLITGDSSAAGVGAASQAEALSGHLGAELARSCRVDWTLRAKTGRTVREVIAALHAAPGERFDVAVICVGVNDVTGATRSAQWVARLRELVGLLASRYGVAHVLFSSLPPMHLFPALPQPLRWCLGARARHFNDLLRGVVAADARCELLELQLPMQPRYIAADGFHPGPDAYALWGQAAATAIRNRLDAADRALG
jgi:lysophospholipase L1-like esterase